MGSVSVAPTLTPHGHLALVQVADAPYLDPALGQRLRDAFDRGSGHGLLQLGAEYLTAGVLQTFWQELDAAFGIELAESKCGVQDFLKQRNPAWNLVGRVHFNLAENRKDQEAPFAFLATYTTRLSAHAKAQHLPLGQALREYAGAANKDRLLSLLLPVQRASEICPWLKAIVDAGEIFHPLRWTPKEAMQLLRDVPQLESAGVVIRMPAAWRANRAPRPHHPRRVLGCRMSACLDAAETGRRTVKRGRCVT